VVTYRDTVAPGMANDVRLPVDGYRGGAFRIHIGPKPLQADSFVIIGIAHSEALARARFDAAVNGQPCAPPADLENPSLMSGAARASRFPCPVEALREGYNEVQVRQLPGEPEQTIVWVELWIQPKRVETQPH
jgi:hypothetical protein